MWTCQEWLRRESLRHALRKLVFMRRGKDDPGHPDIHTCFPPLDETHILMEQPQSSFHRGEGGIRTPDAGVLHNSFRDCRLQPLGHLS